MRAGSLAEYQLSGESASQNFGLRFLEKRSLGLGKWQWSSTGLFSGHFNFGMKIFQNFLDLWIRLDTLNILIVHVSSVFSEVSTNLRRLK